MSEQRGKNNFLEPEKLFFAKPGLTEFHESSAEKNTLAAVMVGWVRWVGRLGRVVGGGERFPEVSWLF
jgi:hypothetical protein